MEVKTYTLKLYKAATRSANVKPTLRSTTSRIHVMRLLKRTLRSSTRLLHTLRKTSRTLQGCYTLCGSQNGLSECLQGCYTLWNRNGVSSADVRPGPSVFVLRPDSWLLFDMKIRVKPQQVYLIYQPHPSTCFLTTPRPHPLLLHRRGCVLPSIPEHLR